MDLLYNISVDKKCFMSETTPDPDSREEPETIGTEIVKKLEDIVNAAKQGDKSAIEALNSIEREISPLIENRGMTKERAMGLIEKQRLDTQKTKQTELLKKLINLSSSVAMSGGKEKAWIKLTGADLSNIQKAGIPLLNEKAVIHGTSLDQLKNAAHKLNFILPDGKKAIMYIDFDETGNVSMAVFRETGI